MQGLALIFCSAEGMADGPLKAFQAPGCLQQGIRGYCYISRTVVGGSSKSKHTIVPLLWEAYYNLTMRANRLRPKADAEAALNITQERF